MTRSYHDPLGPARHLHTALRPCPSKDTTPPALARQDASSPATDDASLFLPCKAITVHPAWAWAIIYGGKAVENRTWNTRYRGPLAIHAGAKRSSDQDRAFVERIVQGLGVTLPHDLPQGVILGVVDLIDCQPYASGFADNPWAVGPFCWILARPRPFAEPIEAGGQQGLWTCQIPALF